MTGLGLVRTKGRVGKEFPIQVSRELTPEDLALAETTEKGTSPPPLQRISERHHALARELAAGATNAQAAAKFGFAPATVSILKSDPAFQELLAFYTDAANQEFADHHEMLAGLSMDAIVIMRERLENNPDEIDIGELRKLAEMSLDRTGYGPSSKQEVNVNVGLADRLDAARKRIKERTLLDITPREAAE